MSQENVKLARAMIEAFDRGDLDAVLANVHPRIVWRVGSFAELTDLGLDPVYVGHEGVLRFWAEWLKAWETVSFEQEDLIDAGPDRVIQVLSQRMRGQASGAEVEQTSYASIWTIRDGALFELEFFRSREEALDAVGLRE